MWQGDLRRKQGVQGMTSEVGFEDSMTRASFSRSARLLRWRGLATRLDDIAGHFGKNDTYKKKKEEQREAAVFVAAGLGTTTWGEGG
jgi:hypothetical protein